MQTETTAWIRHSFQPSNACISVAFDVLDISSGTGFSLIPCIYTRVTLPWLKLWLTQSVEHQRHWGSESEWDSHKQA